VLVAIHFGIDPVHFGIIMVVNLAMVHDHAAVRRQSVRCAHRNHSTASSADLPLFAVLVIMAA
jgi:hypothetical protein